MKRLLALALCLPAISPAYYHFIRYNSRTAPFVSIPQKFDLNALPDRTVNYFVTSDSSQVQFAAGDSFAAAVSQIRAAAQVWNDVAASDLRVAFGGFSGPAPVNNVPGIEVVFDELPPGLVAMGGPTTVGDPVASPSGLFSPISRSLVVVKRDLRERPSYSERFFLTMVHEFGHALGLQHSWCSGVMSTEITRATTKAAPLASDDVAGIAALYPARQFQQNTGSITGRVTAGGSGIALASVVALSTNGVAIGALTHPDGTYRIEGVPGGAYYVYAHPLPPGLQGEPQPVNLVLPQDVDRNAIQPGSAFDLQFYPQSRIPSLTVTVNGGSTTENISFPVQTRARVNVHSGQSYSFYGQEAVKPAHVLLGSPFGSVILFGYGMTSAAGPLPGLNVSVIGAPETIPAGPQAYVSSPQWLQLDVRPSPVSGEASRHLLFNVNGESYVLPSAFKLVSRRAPTLTSVSDNPDRTVTITGSNIGPGSTVWFDGARATVQQSEEGRLVVVAPPAPSGHRAVVTAMNPDGQSSLFTMGASSLTYTYEAAEATQLFVSPSTAPVGVDTVVEIVGNGNVFPDTLTRLGFGTSDIVVRKIWVLGPRRLLANITVLGNATPGVTQVTASSGLLTTTAPFGFQINPRTGREIAISLQGIGDATFVPGGLASLPVLGLTQGSNVQVTVNDRAANVLNVSTGQVTIQVPPGTSVGPGTVRMTVNGSTAIPLAIQISPPPAQVLAAQTLAGTPITPVAPVRAGDFLQLIVSGLTEAGYTPERSQVKVVSGTLEHQVMQVVAIGTNLHAVQVALAFDSPNGLTPFTLIVDGRSSNSVNVPVLGR